MSNKLFYLFAVVGLTLATASYAQEQDKEDIFASWNQFQDDEEKALLATGNEEENMLGLDEEEKNFIASDEEQELFGDEEENFLASCGNGKCSREMLEALRKSLREKREAEQLDPSTVSFPTWENDEQEQLV